MDKHTQGPWIIEAQGIYANGGHKRVATAMSHEHEIDWPTTMANARLIAAAPELLEALLRVLRDVASDGLDGWEDQARAAITKATGEQK
jgi:hypothetical protein